MKLRKINIVEGNTFVLPFKVLFLGAVLDTENFKLTLKLYQSYSVTPTFVYDGWDETFYQSLLKPEYVLLYLDKTKTEQMKDIRYYGVELSGPRDFNITLFQGEVI